MRKGLWITGIIILLLFSITSLGSGRPVRFEKVSPDVLQEIGSKGMSSVIVVLREPGKMEGFPQKSAAALQENVLSGISKSDFAKRHSFRTVNGFSGKVTGAGLEKLENNPDVVGVYPDMEVHALLDDSVPIVNGTSAWNIQVGGTNITGTGETVCVIDTGVNYSHTNLDGCSIENLTQTGNEVVLGTPVESAHPYANDYNNTWKINYTGFENIAVHFEVLGTEANYDHVYVFDNESRIIGIYSGSHNDTWSSYSRGDTIYVSLVTDGLVQDYGFKIDRILNGTTNTTYSWDNCSRAVGGWDVKNSDPDPMDDHGHGTHCAGIVMSNHTNYTGVAPDASLVAVKALASDGSGNFSDIMAGMEWCINNSERLNISVMSMSIGINGWSTQSYCDDNSSVSGPLLSGIVQKAVEKGILVAVAAGNDNADGLSSPACIENVTAVGATDKNDNVASYSNTWWTMDLFAPGGGLSGAAEIYSTSYTGGFTGKHGTSMAAPHVSGAAALLYQYERLAGHEPEPLVIEKYLEDTGKNITDTNGVFPRIDVYSAIMSIDVTPPYFHNHTRSPSSPDAGQAVQVNVTVDDLNSSMDTVVLEWNGTKNYTVPSCGSEYCFTISPGGNYTPHENVTYRWYANDSLGNMNASGQQWFVVANRMPSTANITLNSTDPLNRTNGTLTGYFGISDPDGDSLMGNQTRWYNNSQLVSEFGNGSFVLPANTSKHQNWTFSVRVFDGYNWSGWENSTITIQNAAPSVNLTKPANVSNWTTAVINYTWSASDMDGDNLSYRIVISAHGPGTASWGAVSLNETYFNSSGGIEGNYEWYVKVNDSENMMTTSNTWTFTADESAPNASGMSVSPTPVLEGENVTVSASVADNVIGVDRVWFNITNSSWSDTGKMSGSYSGEYNTSGLGAGYYNMIIIANDTLGNTENKNAGSFRVSEPRNISVSVLDYNSSAQNATVRILYNGTGNVRNGSDNVSLFESVLPAGFWDILVYNTFNLTLRNVNVTANITGNASLDSNITEGSLSPPSDVRDFVESVGAESGFGFDSVTVVVPYDDSGLDEDHLSVWACHNWSLVNRTCLGSWENVSANSTFDTENNTVSVYSGNLSAFSLAQDKYCGDGTCDSGESCSSCSADCGNCPDEDNEDNGNGGNGGGGMGGGPSETYGTDFAELPENISVMMGGTETLRVLVNNTGTGLLEETALTAVSGCRECMFSVEPDSVIISPGIVQEFLVEITVPGNQSIGTYNLTLSVESLRASIEKILNLSILLCKPGSGRCVNGSVQSCSREGMNWEEPEECEHGCESGVCLPEPPEKICESGSKKCRNLTVMECSGGGTAWESVIICPYRCLNGKCVEVVAEMWIFYLVAGIIVVLAGGFGLYNLMLGRSEGKEI